ncbi:MAG: hypothetical protein PHR71_08085, partial [Polaromonas sp.]|nr:hypothetical protein [Polaromonas sp.]
MLAPNRPARTAFWISRLKGRLHAGILRVTGNRLMTAAMKSGLQRRLLLLLLLPLGFLALLNI